jgi:hypothetical protein
VIAECGKTAINLQWSGGGIVQCATGSPTTVDLTGRGGIAMCRDEDEKPISLSICEANIIEGDLGRYTYEEHHDEVRDHTYRSWDDECSPILDFSYDVPYYRTRTVWWYVVYEIVDEDQRLGRRIGSCSARYEVKRCVREYEARQRSLDGSRPTG